jgi:hypothetical protein
MGDYVWRVTTGWDDEGVEFPVRACSVEESRRRLWRLVGKRAGHVGVELVTIDGRSPEWEEQVVEGRDGEPGLESLLWDEEV